MACERNPRYATKLLSGGLCLVPVMFHVKLGRFRRVMRGVVQMSLSRVGVMRGRFVIPRFVMLGGFTMMMGRVFVVFRRFLMMLRRLFGHDSSSTNHRD
jgi:hypothetical protein